MQTVQTLGADCAATGSECFFLGADCADFGCRLCSSGPGMFFWVQTVQQRARNEFIWVQTVQTMDELEIPKVGGNEIARERKRFR